jgi:acyl carrier protein
MLVAKALACAPDDIPEAAQIGLFPAWDSFGHLNVMLALEEHYQVAISDETIRRFETFVAIRERYEELGIAEE